MGAPMPDEIRAVMRGRQHPARQVECPRCGAQPHRPCRPPSRTRILTEPHPARVSAWARTTAVCPACQVEPGVPCHQWGRPLHNNAVHPQRQADAERHAPV